MRSGCLSFVVVVCNLFRLRWNTLQICRGPAVAGLSLDDAVERLRRGSAPMVG